MSILRMLSYNPYLASAAPRFTDTRKFKVTKKLLKNSEMLKSLFAGMRDFFMANRHEVRWPKARPPFRPLVMVNAKPLEVLVTTQRRWLSAHDLDFSASERTLRAVSSGAASYLSLIHI